MYHYMFTISIFSQLSRCTKVRITGHLFPLSNELTWKLRTISSASLLFVSVVPHFLNFSSAIVSCFDARGFPTGLGYLGVGTWHRRVLNYEPLFWFCCCSQGGRRRLYRSYDAGSVTWYANAPSRFEEDWQGRLKRFISKRILARPCMRVSNDLETSLARKRKASYQSLRAFDVWHFPSWSLAAFKLRAEHRETRVIIAIRCHGPKIKKPSQEASEKQEEGPSKP